MTTPIYEADSHNFLLANVELHPSRARLPLSAIYFRLASRL
jgi:hypothetical protein